MQLYKYFQCCRNQKDTHKPEPHPPTPDIPTYVNTTSPSVAHTTQMGQGTGVYLSVVPGDPGAQYEALGPGHSRDTETNTYEALADGNY